MEKRQEDPQDRKNMVQNDQGKARYLKTAQNLLVAAAILCPLSLFLPGGIFLSTAGIVCSAIALNRSIKLARAADAFAYSAKRIKIMSIICFGACILAFGLNAAAIAVMYPLVVNALETGDFSALGIDGENLRGLTGLDGSSQEPKRSPTWG